jgi:hypothetical protein
MSKVTKPIGKMAHTRGLILMFLPTLGRPARTSEIRQAVLAQYPEAAIYGAISDMQTAGEIKRLSFERNALFALRV